MRVKNLRFFRCIDVFKITISRLPAAEEHLLCSSAAGRHTSIQTPFWGWSGAAPEQVFSRVSCLIVRSGCTTQVSARERGLRGYGSPPAPAHLGSGATNSGCLPPA